MSNIVIPDGGNIGSASDTDAIAISSGGNVTLAENVYLGSGKGIYFDGQTTSANFLDDYEEGTFTVRFSGNSLTDDETFSYTKIGNQVTVVGRVVFDVGAGGHTITISSPNNTLPFTPKTNTSAILVSTMNRLIDNATDGVQLLTDNGNATLYLKRVTTATDAYTATNLNAVQKTNVSSPTAIYSTFSGTYLTS
jgi:hypothetical protein